MHIIAGSARGKKIEPPPDGWDRPDLDIVRRLIFSTLADRVEGSTVLDLFAGAGILGLEALSRGARHVTFVDQSVVAVKVLEKNVEDLGFSEETSVLCADAMEVPGWNVALHPFGVVLMYPPSGMFLDVSRVEGLIARITALLRSPATNQQTVLLARFPSAHGDPLPFSGYEEVYSRTSKLVLLKETSLRLCRTR